MKEVNVDINWRTVQMFLDDDGIYEVEIDVESSRKIRCSCQSFSTYARCKHQKWVRDKMSGNDGHFSIQVPIDLDEEDAIHAMMTPEGFRDFVIRHGKVEVI